LNYQLTSDFITFWLPILESYEACYITILNYEECNSIATLSIDADNTGFDLTRFYMIYSPLNTDQINQNLNNDNLVLNLTGLRIQ
jgi:hypothetical protein